MSPKAMRFARLSRQYRFQAAHRLPRTDPNHKCHRLHGHTYHVRLYARGSLDEDMGWLVDFSVLDECWSELKPRLDHRDMNDLLDNPTSENLAYWILLRVRARCGLIYAVELQENPDSIVRIEFSDTQAAWKAQAEGNWEPQDLEAATASAQGGSCP